MVALESAAPIYAHALFTAPMSIQHAAPSQPHVASTLHHYDHMRASRSARFAINIIKHYKAYFELVETSCGSCVWPAVSVSSYCKSVPRCGREKDSPSKIQETTGLRCSCRVDYVLQKGHSIVH